MFALPISPALSAKLLSGFLLSILLANHAVANPLEDIRNLVQAGKAPQALAEIRALPSRLATSMEAALLEAEALSAQGKHTKAEILLYELIQRMPSRPEPYNNLAVILARQGDVQGAQETLEKGMNVNPAYAALYRNLTQIYVDKARNAYSKALQLGESQRQSQLNPLLAMASVPQTAASSIIAATTPATPPSATGVTPPVNPPAIAAAPIAPVSKPTPTAPIARPATTSATGPVSKPVAQQIAQAANQTANNDDQRLSAVEDANTPMNLSSMKLDTGYKAPKKEKPTITNSAKAPQPASPAATRQINPAKKPPLGTAQQAVKHVLGWAEAWSRQSPRGYLAAYSSRYTPPRGATRKAWQAQRQQRILNPKWIKVELSNFKVAIINDNQLTVDFRQNYQSNRFNSTVRKRMVLIRENGSAWRILSERVTGREIVH